MNTQANKTYQQLVNDLINHPRVIVNHDTLLPITTPKYGQIRVITITHTTLKGKKQSLAAIFGTQYPRQMIDHDTGRPCYMDFSGDAAKIAALHAEAVQHMENL